MKKGNLFLILVTVALLTGCASYQAKSLSTLDTEYIKDYQEVDGMSIGCRAYSVRDCYNYLDRDVIAQGYQPIQLTFLNPTSKRYGFSTAEISLPCANPEEVARTVHTSTVGRVTGYAIGGFFLTPLFIPAIVDGIKSSGANKALDIDYADKARDYFVIGPKSYSKTLIFVPKAHFAPIFNLSLLEEATGEHKVISLSVVQ